MKVVNICILDHLKDINIENDNVDVVVEMDDGYTYTLSLATPKHIQFLMDKEKMNYYGPAYPFIIVNKLTPEIIEQAVKNLAEDEDDGDAFWLKVYHFGGWEGAIDESIFEQIKAKKRKEERESKKLEALELLLETKCTLRDFVNKTELIYLVEQYRSGNRLPGIKTRLLPRTCVTELKARSGARIYFQEKNDIIEVVAICDKDNQNQVSYLVSILYIKEE
jgi:hypothetical protein